MFVDIYITGEIAIEKDDIEDALADVLGDDGEIVGGGSGLSMINLDIEIFDSVRPMDIVKRIAGAIKDLGLPLDTVLQTAEPNGRMTVADLVY